MNNDDPLEQRRRRAALFRGAAGTKTAQYLKQIQRDTASQMVAAEDPQDLENAGPAYLRSRAAHYRELAAQQRDPNRARLFNELAVSFEKHAVVKERRQS